MRELPLYDMGDGNWVVIAPDEYMFIEDLSRADSLRICGPNRELPRGIGNGRSYRFGGAWYTPDELEMFREEAKLLAMLKPAGDAESEVHEVLCRCVPADGSVLVPDGSAGPDDLVIDESNSNIGKRRALPRKDDGSEWVIISGNEFFGRIVRAWSIWAELEDLALVEFGSQMVACQRMKKELIEGMLESLGDAWRETLRRLQRRDMGSILSDNLGAAPVVDGEGVHLRADDGDYPRISGCYDQLDLLALAGMERLSKHLQLIKESKTADGAAAYEGAKFFMGYWKTGALVASGLGRRVTHKVQEEVSVMKERRKHAEERGLARGPPAKGGKTT